MIRCTRRLSRIQLNLRYKTKRMYYAITHLTTYQYSEPITDSVMKVRMQPRTDAYQQCLRFKLSISPEARPAAYKNYLGNMIHTFDIPGAHEKLAIKAEAIVEVQPYPALPVALPESAWDTLDERYYDRDCYDMLINGRYVDDTSLLKVFASEINWRRRDDPLTLLRELNHAIYTHFEYHQHITTVDSTIDIALEARGGVCQDFAHIMLALVRQIGIPARYVSGYLFHREDRSDEDASHAWIEAWLPSLGWVGFDPTNDLIAADRHIRVCVANDYERAAPSNGVFLGSAETELEVRVEVSKLDSVPLENTTLAPNIVMPQFGYTQQQQQQQQ